MDKTALKKAYKQTKRPMGVYAIRSCENNMVYIGHATDIQAKFNRHKAELKFGNHRNLDLQATMKSLGDSAFTFEVLDLLDHKEDSQTNIAKELQLLAEMWINKLEQEGHSIVRL